LRVRGANGAVTVALVALVVATTLAGCSTVDRGLIDECQDDTDCGTGSVCSLAQGNICVPEVLPPQTALGFDIREGDGLRIELKGCDPEVIRELGGSELRVQKRESLVRNYQLRASEARTVGSCDECEDTCNAATLTCTAPADADLGLSMGSRLALAALEVKPQGYVIPPEGELPLPVGFDWPTYESLVDPAARSALVLQVSPPADTAPRSRYLRAIAPDTADEIDSAALDRCERAIIGPEATVRTFLGVPISGANVEFVHDEAIASPVTVLGTGAACVESTDCPPGWACNEGGSCGLDLNGVSAGSAKSLAVTPGALPPAYLYTYCEDVEAGEDLERKFSVRVTPPDESGLPNMIYDLSQTFPYPPAPGTLTEINLQDAEGKSLLCLPDWQPPVPVSFSVSGSPITLTETELGIYTCCSTECLPSPEPGVEPTPPPQVEACSGFTVASFETRWVNHNENALAWAFAGCIATGANSDGSSGRYVSEVNECAPEGCSVLLTSGEPDELTRDYTVSIEQRADSVFRSQRYTNVSVTAATEALTFALEPRVLLRGQIVCSTGNCSAQSAVVAAERLRSDTDTGDPIGPFEFEARVDAAGNFVMPVDPGVYVVTAYPGVGQPGGPAQYEVVDLREDSELIDDIDGVPNATLPAPLELEEGVLVRVQLRDFAVSTRVLPLDIGSWKYQNDFPEDLDLNDPKTCPGSSTRGCSIRRLRATDTPISLLLSGKFQFTTRDRGEPCG
jgi:hypothetical protein